MRIERRQGVGLSLLMECKALEESEFHYAGVLVEAGLTGHPSHGLQRLHRVQRDLMVAGRAGSALAPDIRGMLDAEFVCKGEVIVATDPGSAPESVPRLSGCLDLVRATPPLKAGTPVGSPDDSAAHRRAEALENGSEVEPRRWRELGRAQSKSSVARGYAL